MVIVISPCPSVVKIPFCVRVAGADHAVQPHLTASGSGHPELRAGKGLTGGAVPLLDDELALGLVLEGQADRAAFLDLNGLGLGINDIAVWSASFPSR